MGRAAVFSSRRHGGELVDPYPAVAAYLFCASYACATSDPRVLLVSHVALGTPLTKIHNGKWKRTGCSGLLTDLPRTSYALGRSHVELCVCRPIEVELLQFWSLDVSHGCERLCTIRVVISTAECLHMRMVDKSNIHSTASCQISRSAVDTFVKMKRLLASTHLSMTAESPAWLAVVTEVVLPVARTKDA